MATPRRKACVECRQQKIRCDVEQSKTPHNPCTRCTKMGLECRILPTSTRNLRQTKAEMRRELEDLRWNMRQTNDPSQLGTPRSNLGPADMQNYSPLEPPASYSGASGTGGSSMSPSYHDPISHPTSRKNSSGQSTLPRTLDSFAIDSKKIDDCFTLFFTHYHALLPILDPLLMPNHYYESSPFLFWAIVTTGSRRYTDDPTILDKTSQLITPLAFSSMALRSTPIPVIQGMLILCTWRLPTNSHYKDMTHVLCGAAVHLATQVGLHVAGVGQDFARLPLKKDQAQKLFRAKLWMQCVIISIRSSCAEGIPPLVISGTFFDGDEGEPEEMLTHVEPDLQFLHKAHVILLKAELAMVRTDLKSTKCDVGVLRSLINIFDSQLQALATSSPSELDTFQLNCCRIHVLSYHFFANPSRPCPDAESLCRLYTLCVSTIQSTDSLAQTANFNTISPSFFERTLVLSGFAVLKIVRSSLAQHLDRQAGEAAYFSVVQFCQKLSMKSGDLGARAAAIMTNLWSSNKVFRRKDGSIESLGLRLRTRLSMSVNFDMFWYWREEFGNVSNPYNTDEGAMVSTAVTQPTTPQYEKQQMKELASQATASTAPPVSTYKPDSIMAPLAPAPVGMGFDTWGSTDYAMAPMFDQFPDYDWAASLDFSTDWPSNPLATGPVAPMPDPNAFSFAPAQNTTFT
ncbi:C6 zinc finger domain-containing protein [Polyplosphaeria fusca]|uniref:C6 zinc finger domain-containing protein n=1 Tax=Polyplosphaeria fusca TaxID=682080 RepID=A0A9P4UYM7_9PLEO|nr:C6 zinc finger domain-containing protein [Polyplosphaeria fusca]